MTNPTPRDCSCGAKPGERHSPGCSVERCTFCGHQAISCRCVYTLNGIDPDTLEEDYPEIYENGPDDEMWEVFDKKADEVGGPVLWTGRWPGEAECIEHGLYAKMVPGQGWVPCDKDDPEATPDLNRLGPWGGFAWNVQNKRWEKK